MSEKSALIGTGFAEDCRKVGQALQADFDANHEKWANEAAESAAKAREGLNEYYLLVSKTSNGMVLVKTIEEVPLLGRIGAVGRNYDAAVVELRFACAYEIAKKGFMALAEARKYCLKYTFRASLGDVQDNVIVAP